MYVYIKKSKNINNCNIILLIYFINEEKNSYYIWLQYFRIF